MKFRDVFIAREDRFSIGVEESTGKFYLSIPVSNRMVDYEEYYELDESSFRAFQTDKEAAREFVEKCRNREMDDLLIIKPGSDRGVPL